MATLRLRNSFELAVGGGVVSGHQGADTTALQDPLEVSVTGYAHQSIGALADDGVFVMYDDSLNFPADWDYLFFKCDADVYLQLVAGATSVTIPVEANQPVVFAGHSLLTGTGTLISAEPVLVDIDKIVLGNYSGGVANFQLALID